MVTSSTISNSFLPAGVATSISSPTLRLSRARPIGEVVEMRPFSASTSSLLTSLYSTFTSRATSRTTTREPYPERSLGILLRLSMPRSPIRSEEHTSELQSRLHLVCRLLLEKKKIGTQLSRPPTATWAARQAHGDLSAAAGRGQPEQRGAARDRAQQADPHDAAPRVPASLRRWKVDCTRTLIGYGTGASSAMDTIMRRGAEPARSPKMRSAMMSWTGWRFASATRPRVFFFF